MTRRFEAAAREALVDRRQMLQELWRLHQVAETELLEPREADMVDLASAQSEASPDHRSRPALQTNHVGRRCSPSPSSGGLSEGSEVRRDV